MMLGLKIMFWLYVVTLVIKVFHLIEDHPRLEKPVNIGTDLLSLILNMVFGFIVGHHVWGWFA